MKSSIIKKLLSGTMAFALCVSLIPIKAYATNSTSQSTSASSKNTSVPDKVLVGYWHNFENGTGVIRLRDVSPNWDVINLSFGEGTTVDSGDIQFTPFNATEEEFKEDVKYLQSQGKKVLISIGGEKGQVQLKTETAKNNFINSVSNIIDTYGLDGLDIDFEGHSLYFDVGDNDFKNPTTPVIVNLIDALKTLKSKYGDNFLLTMAPETFFVQNGFAFYGNNGTGADARCGAYLPVIYALRDELDWLQVQYYNSGPIKDLNGKYQNMGNAEFYVALADMLLKGFNIAGKSDQFFPALRPDQVVIGVPCCVNAGNGYVDNAGVQQAMDALINGGTVGGYTISEGYPELRGLMTWSINWDQYTKFNWSDYFRNYLDKMVKPTLKAPSISLESQNSSKINLQVSIPARNTGVFYEVYQGDTEIAKGTVSSDESSIQTFSHEINISNLPYGIYDYSVVLYDSTNTSSANKVTSNVLSVDTNPGPNTAPVLNGVSDKTIEQGDEFYLLDGITATDKQDGNLTSQIEVSGNINTFIPGSYKLTYTVSDKEGLTTSAAATITVKEKVTTLYPAYSASTLYNPGDYVTYNNAVYKCLWYAQGVAPDSSTINWEKTEDAASEPILSLATMASKYRLKEGDAGYENKYDANKDCIIDIVDIVSLAKTM